MLQLVKKLLTGALVAVLFLAACGSEPEPVYRFTYNVDGFTVHSEAPLHEQTILYNLQLAKKLLVPAVVPDEATFYEAFRDIPIYVRLATEWKCSSDGQGNVACSKGNYDATFGISLGGNMESLAHEMLHAWETSEFVFATLTHPDWSRKGYYSLCDRFMALKRDPR